MRLGRLQRPAGARFLRLRDVANVELLPAPPAWDGTPGATIAMYGNDRLGDCTCAAVANLASVQAASEGQALAFTEADVVAFYNAITGGADVGAVEIDVLRRVQAHGFPLSGAWRLRAWAGLEHGDHDELRAAAAIYTGAYLGVELPDRWEAGVRAGIWSDTSGEPNPDNGHALVLVGYDQDHAVLATWGATVRATWAWMARYVVEAYVLLDEARCAVDVLQGADLIAKAAELAAASGNGG